MSQPNTPGTERTQIPTTVYVHGVPETASLWDDVRGRIDAPSIALALPGFQSASPAGFTHTMQEYLAWVSSAVSGINGPVHLVGHDWGGILVAKLALDPPSNVRSYVTDAPGALSEQFRWHDAANIWRTPGEGEAFWEAMLADRNMAAEMLTGFGLSHENAAALIAQVDEPMVDAILRLYRSSDDLGVGWVVQDPAPIPGLIVGAADDPFISADGNRSMAERFGARFEMLPSGGHFWPVEAAEAAASAIATFHASLD